MATTFADHLLGPDTHANRPAATAVPSGTLYSCNDHDIVYQSDGATWSDWATLAGQASSALKITTSVRNESGATLTAGTPVYISGFNVGQDIIEVEAADSTSEATLPAIGLVEEDIANSATGTVVLIGNVEALDTSSYTSGDKLYVSETAGELTTTKPTGAALVQLMGEVLRSNATTGQIEVTPGLVSNSGFAATLLDDPDAATARDTLGVIETIGVACSDESTAIAATGTKTTFRMPYGMTVTDVRATLTGACTTGTFTVDINEGGTTILSTKLTIDATEKTSTTAAIAAVISDAALADDAEITIDVDDVGDGTATGLKVWLIGTLT